jgi:hypothetical protein
MVTRRAGQRPKIPAREFLILVGGPSNTFNGYGHFDPATGAWVPENPPADTSPAQIGRYIHGDGTHPQEPTGTHDLFWANFIYSGVKLVELRGRSPFGIAPAAGDLLTFMIYLPPYGDRPAAGDRVDRQWVDWEASPHNLLRHRNSVWVAGRQPYDPTVRQGEQGAQAPPRLPQMPQRPATQSRAPTFSANEHAINHEILMRTTAVVDRNGLPLPDGGFEKRPRSAVSYLDAILDIPRRLVIGSKFGRNPPVVDVPPLNGVLVKLLFLRDVADLFAYLESGAWIGQERLHLGDQRINDEEAMSLIRPLEECTWSAFGRLPVGVDTLVDWDTTPAVDRSRVRLKRLDYVGHSAGNELFLQYGLRNDKGEEPEGEVMVTGDDLAARLSTSLFTPDARVFLWGCNLGESLAAKVAPSVRSVRACLGFTLFDHVLDDEANLPTPQDPVNAGWKMFP